MKTLKCTILEKQDSLNNSWFVYCMKQPQYNDELAALTSKCFIQPSCLERDPLGWRLELGEVWVLRHSFTALWLARMAYRLDDFPPAPKLHAKSHVWDLDWLHTNLILLLCQPTLRRFIKAAVCESEKVLGPNTVQFAIKKKRTESHISNES